MLTRWLPLLCLLALAPAARAEEEKQPDLFQSDKVWTFHLTVSEKDWEAMQPTGGRMGFGPGQPRPPERREEKKDAKRDAKVGAFGMTFPFGKAKLEFAGNTWNDVGIRFKGNSTYMASSRGMKRPFKLDLNHHVKGQVFHGQTMLNLS